MKLKLLVLVLALQTAWILATTFTQERALASGTVITLETVPVDPRDLLRGDYITLGYKISRLPLTLFSPARTDAPAPGAKVYVAMEPRGTFYEAVMASDKPIEPAPGQVVLQGSTLYSWGNQTVRVEYGLEKYYVREGTGNPQGKITVRAAVPGSGNAQIKEVLVDGKPYKEAVKTR